MVADALQELQRQGQMQRAGSRVGFTG